MSRAVLDLLVLGSLMAALGGGLLTYALRRRRRPLAWAGGLILTVAGLFAIEAARLPRFPHRNPVPATAQSVATGQRLYRAHCAVCHGHQGRGDGPAAAALKPRPGDLRRTSRMSDAALFERITQGLPGTAMPAFRDTLTEEERWHVVNYLRHLTGGP